MGRAKEIEVKVIPSKIANPFVKSHHYSGKVVPNSVLHFGAFLDGDLHGVMSYGPPMDKSKILGLVDGTGWNQVLELNRMAFDDYLPRFSESHCISQSIKLIRKNAPQIKWIVSFADGCQCGDGTIYRASNFILTGIKENKTILEFPTGDRVAAMTLEAHFDLPVVRKICNYYGIDCKYRTRAEYIKLGAKYVDGYMLRYLFFVDKKFRKKLLVPELPFSKIDEMGAGMYKGEKVLLSERHEDGVDWKKQLEKGA